MKINDFGAILEKKNSDFALFYNSDSAKYNANMYYFSGYNGLGALIIPRKNPHFLLCPIWNLKKRKNHKLENYTLWRERGFSIQFITLSRKIK